MVNVAILGSTGSIGTQTMQVLDNLPDYRVYGISGHRNIDKLREQIQKHQPKVVVVGEESMKEALANYDVQVLYGDEGLLQLAADPNVDLVVSALVGFSGLAPTLAALQAGKRVALANKESLVVGGHLVMQYRSQVIPIDSEHSAIWQILDGKDVRNIDAIILTASGGPFRDYSGDLSKVTVEQALQHPTWRMGGKITIDSATLMNKGLEVIEAHWLFNVSYDQIEVVIHPQSIIHSMVRFIDGSIMAQMSTTDMRLPIQYAITYPRIIDSPVPKLDLLSLHALTFQAYDPLRFPCLDLAYTAGKIGGTMPAVLNAANEVAVNLFMHQKIAFTDISLLIHEVMQQHQPIKEPSLEELICVDHKARLDTMRLSEHIGRKG